MKTGTEPYSSCSFWIIGPASASGTSKPGQPYHTKVVVLDNPLRPETSPPEDIEKAYEPSSERLIVMGSRFDTRSNLPWTWGSWTTEGIGGMFEGSGDSWKAETMLRSCGCVNVVRDAV